MNLQELLFLLAGGTMVLALIPAVLLLREATVPSRLLAIALLVAAANILHALIASPHNANILLEPLQFLLPPLFAAYVRALFQPQWRPRGLDLLHFLPSAIVGYSAVFLTTNPFPQTTALAISLTGWALLLVQAMIYVGRAILRIRQYRLALKREQSNLNGLDPLWLFRYALMLHLVYLGYLVIPAILIHLGDLSAARHVISLLMTLAVGYLAIHQILGIRLVPLTLAPEPNHGSAEKGKLRADSALSSLPSPDFDPELPAALTLAMEERRLYRKPNLDLGTLANELGWQRNEVSAAINGHFRCNFYDFINGYRVAEAKRLLADPANSQLTILALGLQAGFNSKPTFNAVFKKKTGLTPSSWQKSHRLV